MSKKKSSELDKARAEIVRLRSALEFYAEPSRYDYDETCCTLQSNPGRRAYGQDVLTDNGAVARAALRPKRVTRTGGTR